MPDYRETTVNLTHEDGTAHVWTNNRGVVNRLRRMGAKVLKQGRSGTFMSCPLAWVSFRKPPSTRRKPTHPGRPFVKRHPGTVAAA